jgi:hypothetical protein
VRIMKEERPADLQQIPQEDWEKALLNDGMNH